MEQAIYLFVMKACIYGTIVLAPVIFLSWVYSAVLFLISLLKRTGSKENYMKKLVIVSLKYRGRVIPVMCNGVVGTDGHVRVSQSEVDELVNEYVYPNTTYGIG
jgi:hypothetical protein